MARNVRDKDGATPWPKSAHSWVRELKLVDEPLEAPACRPETIAMLVGHVGEGAAEWAVALGKRIAERAIRQFPDFGGWPGAESTLRLGTEHAAISILRSIDAGELIYTPKSADIRSMVHDYVQRRVPMERIWHGMRSGHAWLTEEFMAACKALTDRDNSPEELEYVSQRAFEVVTTFAAEVGELYRVENDAWLHSAEFARDEVIRSVLVAEEIDEDSASHVLRYSLAQHHVSCVATAPGSAASSVDPAAHATEVLGALGVNTTMIVRRSEGEVHAWGGSNRRVSRTEADEIAAMTTVGDGTVTVGLGGRGADGFRRAFHEASRAASIVASLGCPPQSVVTYNQVCLVGLLLENREEATEFAERELGKLAGRSQQMTALRETLLAYLEHRHSPRSAAEKLYIAKNTVIYRIKKAEELMGHSIDERPAETWAALLVAQALYRVEQRCTPRSGADEGR